MRRITRMLIMMISAALLLFLPHGGMQSYAEATAPTTTNAGYQQGAFQAGMAVLLYNTDYVDQADFDQKLASLFDRLIADHVNAIALAWPIYTDDVRGSSVYRGEKTPPDDILLSFMQQAVSRGFMVTLHPIIDELSIAANGTGEWRGTIRPRDVNGWFASYSDLLGQYAALAEQGHAHAIAVGTELNSMEKYTTKWRSLIAAIRQKFSGLLTYSSNQGVGPNVPWDALDFVGIDAFFELQTRSATNASVSDMIASWQKWIPGIERRAKQIGKPVVFSEIGVASQQGAHVKSWLWSHNSAVDLEEQRRFYEAVCAVWKKRIQGIYWWDTTIWFLPDPANDGSFMPIGKPAEGEIAKCFQ